MELVQVVPCCLRVLPRKRKPLICAPPNSGALPVWWALAPSGMPLPWLWCTIPQPLQAVSTQPVPIFFQGLTSKTQASAASPHPSQQMSISGGGGQGSDIYHLCKSLSATLHKLVLLSSKALKLPLSPGQSFHQ